MALVSLEDIPVEQNDEYDIVELVTVGPRTSHRGSIRV